MKIQASVAHTHFMMGDYENVLTCSSAADALYIHPLALSQLGREREALELLRKGLQDESALPLIRLNGTSLLALLEGRRDDCVREAEQYLRSSFRDPESLYYFARQFTYLGKHARALEVLREVIELGHVCFPALARDPWFDSLRSDAGFVSLLRAAETRHREAAQAFLTADGCRILGVPAS